MLWAVSSGDSASADERKPAPLRRWARRLLWAECAVAGLAILGLAGWFFYNWIRGEPEPVLMMEPSSWTSGVSTWPRSSSVAWPSFIAVLLMIKASETVDVNITRLARQRLRDLLGTGAAFAFELVAELSCAARRLLKAIFASLRFQKVGSRRCWSVFGSQVARIAPQDREPRTIEKLLENIHGRPHRVLRITTLAIVYFVFSILLFAAFPTYTPGRRDLPFCWSRSRVTSGGLYIVHLLYCLDLHLGAQMLLGALRGHLAENKNIDEYKVLETAGDIHFRRWPHAALPIHGAYHCHAFADPTVRCLEHDAQSLDRAGCGVSSPAPRW